jgi:CMP-N-acetylneuraminic acid synthetase
VHEKRNFYWDTAGVLKTEYPGTMDTKLVEMVYEAAHCLYAGKMSRIGEGIYLGNFTKNDPELFTVEEKETFDIDYEWQFRVAEVLYKNREYVLNEQ